MLILLTLLLSLFLSLFIIPKKADLRSESLADIFQLTSLPFLTNSTTFLEHRVTPYQDFSNKLYPEMQQLNYQEFVYAQ